MKNNLEDISFTEVCDENGKSYNEFRTDLVPHFHRVRNDIILGWACLVLILAIAIIMQKENWFRWPYLLMGSLLLGYDLAYIQLFIHEAAHYNIHPDRLWNDRISDYLIGVFSGISMKGYRKIHWQHHQQLGSTKDSEHSYFNTLNIIFLIKSLVGFQALSIILDRKSKLNDEKTQSSKVAWFYIYVFFFHLTLLFILFFLGGWKVVSMWLIGLVSIFPLFGALRQLLEHRDINVPNKANFANINHGKVSRLFSNNFIDRSFGAAGFNRHLIHHWDPLISYTRLREVEAFLSNCPQTAKTIRESKTTYFKTFIRLFKFR